MKGKKVYLTISSGGIFSEGPMKVFDFTESYLRAVLGFMGMTDVTAFRVEGTAMPGIKETAFEKALETVRREFDVLEDAIETGTNGNPRQELVTRVS